MNNGLRGQNVQHRFGVFFSQRNKALVEAKPSKCPKFHASRILGEQNVHQKVLKFCQNINRDKMKYLIKYTLTVQFSIKDYTRQLPNSSLLNMKNINR